MYVTPYRFSWTIFILGLALNKNIKMSSFKSSENIQRKEGGPDRSVSDNQSSSVTQIDIQTNCWYSDGYKLCSSCS